jgi:hypothetical protein
VVELLHHCPFEDQPLTLLADLVLMVHVAAGISFGQLSSESLHKQIPVVLDYAR